jgi:4-amino-4-deoxy-L-arabinose transferase-like glycosyltransferase
LADPPRADRRRTALIGGLAVAAAVLAGMLATGPRMAIAWDEAYTIARLERVRLWFAALADPIRVAAEWRPSRLHYLSETYHTPAPAEIDTRAELFAPRTLGWFWPFAREEPHGHPPFYALVALAGDSLAPGWPTLARARLGTMIAFSLAAGFVFAFLARRWGPWPGLVGAGAWALHPHLFGLGHYATYDALLSSLWLGAILAFARAVEPLDPEAAPGTPPRSRPRWGWAVAFGVLTGWAAGTKLTGWFLPLPMLAWTALTLNRRGVPALLVGGIAAALTLYVFTPPFWVNPLDGLWRFFASNLTRHETIPIKTLFLGQIYETPKESLPPYNTLAWTFMVTPVGFLALSLAGLARSVRRWRTEPFGALVLIHWLFLLALRAMPHTPGHDGVRQFLPAFGGLALMAGYGSASALERLGRWARPALAAALVEGLASVAVMMPVPLSYYSPLVGGLPGAARLGMEPTYYWDALTDGALARIDAATPPGRTVFFVANPIAWFYRETGRLKSGVYPGQGRDVGVYVLQNRPGAMEDVSQELIALAGSKPEFIVEQKLGVPLIWAFPMSEVEARPGPPGGPAR